jgi:hypothetical protein
MKPGQLLTHPEVEPTSDALRIELGRLFPIYEVLTMTLKSPDLGVSPEWRFYKDGGAWLCKMTRKKTTVFWLSAWESCLKCAFYFTAKTGEGISDLAIHESLKLAFEKAEPIGKLYPLVIEVRAKKQLSDLYAVATYKISLK